MNEFGAKARALFYLFAFETLHFRVKFKNHDFRKLSTSLDLPKLESTQRRILGHIWVFFITQTGIAPAIIKGVFNHQPPADLGDKRSSSREKAIPSGSLQYHRPTYSLASCSSPLVRFRNHRFDIDDGCPV